MTALLEPQSPQPSQSPIVADSELMRRLAQRDSTALVELERRHRGSLYAMAYSTLMDAGAAERVVRDAFAQLCLEAIHHSKRRPLNLLRDLTRELARAERALRDSRVHRR